MTTIKTWQERVELSGYGPGWATRSRDAEIADLRAALQAQDGDAYDDLVKHADVHAAQRYEAGVEEGEVRRLEMADEFITMENRAEAAQSSLARLVEWQKKAEATMIAAMPIIGFNNEGCAALLDEINALLPAKAEAPTTGPAPDVVAAGPDIATPAPAMGEELPFPTVADILNACKNIKPDETGKEHPDVYVLAIARACMALRQPVDSVAQNLDAQLRSVIHQRDLLGKAISDALLKAGIWNGEVPLHGPHLLMMLPDLTEMALRPAGAEKCEGCNGHGMVGNILDSDTCPFCKGSGEESIAATAPVSQPAAQEPILYARQFELDAPSSIHGVITSHTLDGEWCVPLYTAPQPITAPAGSEQKEQTK